jgi:Ion channel
VEIIALLLLAITVLKAVAIVNATRWLSSSGRRYTNALATRPDWPPERIGELAGADFFPFGLKDHQLERLARQQRAWPGSRLARMVISGFRTVLFNQPMLVFVTSLYVMTASTLLAEGHQFSLLPAAIHDALLYILAIAALATTLLMSIEAVFAYATLGSYAVAFHGRSPLRSRASGGTVLLTELQVFIGIVFGTCFAGASACYVAAVHYNGMHAIGGLPTGNPLLAAGSAFTCLYFAVTTFATGGANDVTPVNIFGRLPAGIIQLQSFSLLILVIACLITVAGDSRHDSTMDGRQARSARRAIRRQKPRLPRQISRK